jgi:hypothetical protein
MEIVYKNFRKYGPVFCKRLSLVLEGIARAGQTSTDKIAASIAIIKGIKFNSVWMSIYRFLSDKKFQIDDALWSL